MSYTHRCMIISTVYVTLAQQLAFRLAGEAGSNMWTTGLSATGNLPATHFISTGLIEQQFADLMIDANAIVSAATAAGTPVPLATVTAMLAASDITEEEPFVAMDKLGLKMIVDPI